MNVTMCYNCKSSFYRIAKTTISKLLEFLLEKGMDLEKIDRTNKNYTVDNIPGMMNSFLRDHFFGAHKCPQTVISEKGKVKNMCKPCLFKKVLQKVKRFPEITYPDVAAGVVQNLYFYLNKFWSFVFDGIFQSEVEQIVGCDIKKHEIQTKTRAHIRGKNENLELYSAFSRI